MSKNKPYIYIFDFDGTLTKKDTLLEFIYFSKGCISFLKGFTLFLPLILLMKLKILPNWKVKQWVFSWYFKGMDLVAFNHLCERFALEKSYLLRKDGIYFINKLQKKRCPILIVSASIDNWVKPFLKNYSVKVICTQVEVKNGYLTGKFQTKNCYGKEKVNRIMSIYPNREDFYLIAFGDSSGDKEMLAFADESYYKYFKN